MRGRSAAGRVRTLPAQVNRIFSLSPREKVNLRQIVFRFRPRCRLIGRQAFDHDIAILNQAAVVVLLQREADGRVSAVLIDVSGDRLVVELDVLRLAIPWANLGFTASPG